MVHYAEPAWWAQAFVGDTLRHAVLAYKNMWFIHAPWKDQVVVRWSFNSLFYRDNPPSSRVVEARIVKVKNITSKQRREVSNYASRFFGVWYPKVIGDKK